jgi:hypothetical protein
MAEKLCLEHINGECRNLAKKTGISGVTNMIGLECPHCLRKDGKDGNGNQLVPADKAEKVFEILKDKVEK